jgi:uncharacterized membrane protein YGL010W
MKLVDQLLAQYGESHQNPTNKYIHWICVPLIMFSLVGVLMTIPFPADYSIISHWGAVVLLLALLYYLRLSVTLFLGFILIGGAILWGNHAIYTALDENALHMLYVSLAIFFIAWVGQFYGHKVEGKKPSFLKDIQFLLIGPAWLLHFIYRKWNIPY